MIIIIVTAVETSNLTWCEIVKEVMELNRRGEYVVYVEVYEYVMYLRHKIIYLVSHSTISSSNFRWRIIKYWS
jgi:hypothetical protein